MIIYMHVHLCQSKFEQNPLSGFPRVTCRHMHTCKDISFYMPLSALQWVMQKQNLPYLIKVGNQASLVKITKKLLVNKMPFSLLSIHNNHFTQSL